MTTKKLLMMTEIGIYQTQKWLHCYGIFLHPTSNLIDQVNLSQLEQPNFEFMQGIFRIAGIWDARKTIFSQNDTNAKTLSQASETLTSVLNDKWNQGKNLKWKLEHTGT